MQALEDLVLLLDLSDPGETVQKLRAQRWTGASGQVFMSLLSNQYGAGKRCVYEPEGALLAGFNERYFYGQSTQKHVDGDLLPFQWCCIDSPQCHLYLRKRPLDRCQSYVSTIRSGAARGTGVVYENKQGFAVRCLSVNRCAAVYASGLRVVVWRSEGYRQLAAMVEVPENFYRRTVGLMGLWSANRSDDFLMSNGKVVPSLGLNPPEEEQLKQFCMSWAVPNPENLLVSSSQNVPLALDSTALLLQHLSPAEHNFLILSTTVFRSAPAPCSSLSGQQVSPLSRSLEEDQLDLFMSGVSAETQHSRSLRPHEQAHTSNEAPALCSLDLKWPQHAASLLTPAE